MKWKFLLSFPLVTHHSYSRKLTRARALKWALKPFDVCQLHREMEGNLTHKYLPVE